MESSIAPIARTDAAHARLRAGGGGTSLPSHVASTPQLGVPAFGVATTVIGPFNFSNTIDPVTEATATVTGTYQAGVSSATASLQVSVGGGGFVSVQTVDMGGVDSPVGAGTVAGKVGTASLVISTSGYPLNPVIPTAWQVIVTPVGGTFTTVAGQGGLMLEEG